MRKDSLAFSHGRSGSLVACLELSVLFGVTLIHGPGCTIKTILVGNERPFTAEKSFVPLRSDISDPPLHRSSSFSMSPHHTLTRVTDVQAPPCFTSTFFCGECVSQNGRLSILMDQLAKWDQQVSWKQVGSIMSFSSGSVCSVMDEVIGEGRLAFSCATASLGSGPWRWVNIELVLSFRKRSFGIEISWIFELRLTVMQQLRLCRKATGPC